jgi:transposase
MPRHCSHGVDFKRQVVAEHHAEETLHALGRRHDLSRNLVRIRIERSEAGALDQDMASDA